MSVNNLKFYIDGAWVDPFAPKRWDVINPATEEIAGTISLGSSADVDRAVAGARKAFPAYSAWDMAQTQDMTIACEEIFGPVLSMMTYHDEDEAIAIANDTPYGLAGYAQSKKNDHARKVAERIRAGRIYINQAPIDRAVPFGGYKQSGNGREMGVFGLEEYLEVKAVIGYEPS